MFITLFIGECSGQVWIINPVVEIWLTYGGLTLVISISLNIKQLCSYRVIFWNKTIVLINCEKVINKYSH
jgi:hypothetical protein